MSNTNKATLSPEDRKTFFRLFIPLLDFTNQKYEINEYLSEDMRRGHPDMQDLKEVADVLWANLETIDEYIEATEKQFGLEEDSFAGDFNSIRQLYYFRRLSQSSQHYFQFRCKKRF